MFLHRNVSRTKAEMFVLTWSPPNLKQLVLNVWKLLLLTMVRERSKECFPLAQKADLYIAFIVPIRIKYY